MKLQNMRRIMFSKCYNCCKLNIRIFTIDDSKLWRNHRVCLHSYYWFWVGNKSSWSLACCPVGYGSVVVGLSIGFGSWLLFFSSSRFASSLSLFISFLIHTANMLFFLSLLIALLEDDFRLTFLECLLLHGWIDMIPKGVVMLYRNINKKRKHRNIVPVNSMGIFQTKGNGSNNVL